MNSDLIQLPEPELEFRYHQRLHDPRDGLSLFGPFDSDEPSHPNNIVYGVIGTQEGLIKLRAWSQFINGPVLTESEPYYDTRNWPHFPGFEAAYNCAWPQSPAFEHQLNGNNILSQVKERDAHKRAGRLVDIYLEGIEIAARRDENFSLIICVVPDEIWKYCRPLSIPDQGVGYRVSKKEQANRATGPDLFGSYQPEDYNRSNDFRRQLKARAMQYNIPIQLIRESTLRLKSDEDITLGKDSPSSAVAWFLSTALYYKSGGKPWRLCSARDGVCYVGLAFRRVDNANVANSRTACCAAQMFLDTGDGIVFKGKPGPWYSPERHECHLSKDAARDLLSSMLTIYKKDSGMPLREIFIHCRSLISDEEYEGYLAACPPGVQIIGIRVRREVQGIKLFRPGEYPVLRGTCLPINDRTCYLWSSGFKPRLESYDGFGVPHPLRIDIQHGSGDIIRVAEDILGLTKLNYNTCRLGQTEPVTIGFSNMVGEILVSNPNEPGEKHQFKFYI